MFDRTDFGPSNLSLPDGKCVAVDCTAHSIIYDVNSNTFRPLTVVTDTWCSSGSVDPTGTLIQTGGYSRGERAIRMINPCSRVGDPCDWEELPVSLSSRRWYASNLLLPDGHVIIVGGRGSHSYEFFPKSPGQLAGRFHLQFLVDTWDGRNKENNLYPFLHLLPNGNLFIFANNRSIEFDYVTGKVVKKFPVMPSTERRNYPSTGSSVLLPINAANSSSPDLEILICGGASPQSFDLADKENVYVAASRTCGRMIITDSSPHWIMEEMPMPRVMPDMVMLPNGDILIVNGAGNGTAGWENADNPVLNPVLYRTYETDQSRKFVVLNPTNIPRMYHSSAVLVPDGRVIVGGSNPHPNYNFTQQAKYPTELSLEGYSPPYLDQQYSLLRPSILAVETESMVVTYGQMVSVTYVLDMYKDADDEGIKVMMLMPPFTTHSFGMNQRMVVLRVERVDQLSAVAYKVTVRVPVNVNVAPSGFYLLFVVHAGVPSHGVWVQLKNTHPTSLFRDL
ncbi:Aldehyde oxidase GLOX [Bienertia sinuspersici]